MAEPIENDWSCNETIEWFEGAFNKQTISFFYFLVIQPCCQDSRERRPTKYNKELILPAKQ